VDRKAENELWGSVSARLVRIAFKWTRHREDSEDLAQEAIAAVLSETPEQPTDAKAIVLRAAKIMKGNFLNQRRAESRRRQGGWLAMAALKTRGLRRTPEDLAAVRERKARLLARLEQDLKSDPLALRIVQATENDCRTAAEQAEALGEGIDEIRRARRRVAYAMEGIREAEGDAHRGAEWEVAEGEGPLDDDPPTGD
jgi:DNA-directed RNA polymerase specialized sigma24 family protein